DVSGLPGSKRAVAGSCRVQPSQDLAESGGHTARLPPLQGEMDWDASDPAGDEPVVAHLVVQPDRLRHRPPALQPREALALVPQIRGPLDEHGATVRVQSPHGAGPAHPGELLFCGLTSDLRLDCGANGRW